MILKYVEKYLKSAIAIYKMEDLHKTNDTEYKS